MDKGRIVEQGTHHSLLKSDGAYARLVKAQDLSFESKSEFDSDASIEGSLNDERDPELVQSTKTLSCYSATTRHRLASDLDRDDYDKWKRVGLLATIWRILEAAPELRMTFLVLILVCFGAGKCHQKTRQLSNEY